MKKIFAFAIACIATSAMAQETYDNAQLITEDLNGTARYVGMGGAMEALGADITTINTNPAGIGLFRRSWAGVSAGFTSQAGDKQQYNGTMVNDGKKTNADLNQIGFVYSSRAGQNSRFNMAVNYHRSRNFNQIATAIGSLNDASASKRAYMSLASWQAGKDFNPVTGADPRYYHISLQDKLTDYNVNSALQESVTDPESGETWYFEGYKAASMYGMQTNNSGYVNNFDFNLSGSYKDRFFYGVTFGLRDIRYRNEVKYDEVLATADNTDAGDYNFTNSRSIDGTGFNLKFGAIYRPIEDNPFRIGVYINTPTWYSLNCIGKMTLTTFDVETKKSLTSHEEYAYKYKMDTPWKFGASLGTTIGENIAIGATYEYSDFSSLRNRIDEGEYVTEGWDYYGPYDSYYSMSSADKAMNDNTKESLRGVSLFKIGAEYKPLPKLSLRAGYNYQSAIYSMNGSKDMCIDSDPDYASVGNYYTTYDYTNWKSTQRVTFGIGVALSQNWNLDMSYQYSTQKGEYHPFQSISELPTYVNSDKGNWAIDNQNPVIGSEDIVFASLNGTPATVKNNRHQVNLTLSYKF